LFLDLIHLVEGVNKFDVVGQAMKQIYKITYPNGKIYVGQDVTGSLTYFGSPRGIVATDFTPEQRLDFTARKQILWESETATRQEVNEKEIEWILRLRSNEPAIGYNRRPIYRNPN
jgi:hypothetical protein